MTRPSLILAFALILAGCLPAQPSSEEQQRIGREAVQGTFGGQR